MDQVADDLTKLTVRRVDRTMRLATQLTDTPDQDAAIIYGVLLWLVGWAVAQAKATFAVEELRCPPDLVLIHALLERVEEDFRRERDEEEKEEAKR